MAWWVIPEEWERQRVCSKVNPKWAKDLHRKTTRKFPYILKVSFPDSKPQL